MSRMWVQYFYNVKQRYSHRIKKSPTELRDTGKIVILHNILLGVTEIVFILYSLEKTFLYDTAHCF